MCTKGMGALPVGKGSVMECRLYGCVLRLPCERARFFCVAVNRLVWYPVDPGSRPGRVTALSLRQNTHCTATEKKPYSFSLERFVTGSMGCHHVFCLYIRDVVSEP